ncbi:MAG: aminopeptidase [Candidatus Sumerlaeaceae bacterium]
MLGPIDPRDRQLAKTLLKYSTKAQPGELVFIMCSGLETLGLGAACVEEAARMGAAPYLQIVDPEIQRLLMHSGNEGVFRRLGRFELKQMKDADCFIGIRGTANAFELSDVPARQMEFNNRHIVKPVHLEERVKRTRWCVLRYPNPAMAQLAKQSTSAFADFYYRVCLVDYAEMARAVKPLQRLMERTSDVHIIGPGQTDLRFSIKDIPVIPCCGEMNIPDGECFTAPVRNSVNGTVQFNAPSVWEGTAYENLSLTFHDGKIVDATAADAAQTRRLNHVLDQDAGARFVGEFSIAFHPQILEPMRDILFDEKIAGSFHMAMGQAYDEASNGNKSTIHWDMVCIQRPEYGGGEIYFDGELVRRNGMFLPKELQGLNRRKGRAKSEGRRAKETRVRSLKKAHTTQKK